MQSLVVRLSRWFSVIVLCVVSFGVVSFAKANEAPSVPSNNPTPSQTFTVATVNVGDISLIKQNESDLTIGFSISNREGVQPSIIYAVNLLQKDASGKQIIIDQKVYTNDIVSLGANDSVKKEIVYTAPGYLKGSYTVEVEARNPDALILGMVQIPNAVTLDGTDQYISIDQSKCFLTVDKEEGNKKYTLAQGVDIAPTETLSAHCTVTNTFQTNKTVTPVFETRYRSTFGKSINTSEQTLVTFASNKKTDFVVVLPTASIDPQAYDVVLTFVDENKAPISNSVDFHYVLRGASATIQNITLDKDAYLKGDTAQVTFVWSGSADGFLGSRIEKTDNQKDISALFTITDDQKNICVNQSSYPLDVNKQANVEHISLPIASDCQNPRVSAIITDADGKVLADNAYDIQSKSTLQEKVKTAPTPFKSRNSTIGLIVYILAFLLILILGIYLIRKNKRSGMMMFFGLVVGLGILTSGGGAKADTFFEIFYLPEGHKYAGADHYIVATFTANLDKSIYTPSETIVASGRYVSTLCANGVILADVAEYSPIITLDATINGQTKSVLDKSENFTAQNVSGVYNAQFIGHDAGVQIYQPERLKMGGTAFIPYIVFNSVQNGVCGSANGKIYPTNQMGYAPDTQCSIGTPSDTSFPIPGDTFSWTCQGVNGGASSPNCSAERLLPSQLKICPSNATLINQGETKDLTLYYDTRNNCDADVNKPSVSVPALSWTIASDPDHGIESLTPSADKTMATVKAVLDGVTTERLATISATYGLESATADVTITNIFPVCGCDATIAETKCNPKTFPGTVGTPVGSPCIQSVCTGTKNCSVQWKEIVPSN